MKQDLIWEVNYKSFSRSSGTNINSVPDWKSTRNGDQGKDKAFNIGNHHGTFSFPGIKWESLGEGESYTI